MHKKIQQIACITSGYTFRGSVENDSAGDISIIQGKNVSSQVDSFETDTLMRISSKALRDPYFLEKNDVLLVSRGLGAGSFRSTTFVSDNENVIASSSVLILRVTDVGILPKFLSLYLNSQEGQNALSKIVTGGSLIQSILIKNLANVKIPMPPIGKQKTIIALHENTAEQERIRIRKREIQQLVLNASFIQSIKN